MIHFVISFTLVNVYHNPGLLKIQYFIFTIILKTFFHGRVITEVHYTFIKNEQTRTKLKEIVLIWGFEFLYSNNIKLALLSYCLMSSISKKQAMNRYCRTENGHILELFRSYFLISLFFNVFYIKVFYLFKEFWTCPLRSSGHQPSGSMTLKRGCQAVKVTVR